MRWRVDLTKKSWHLFTTAVFLEIEKHKVYRGVQNEAQRVELISPSSVCWYWVVGTFQKPIRW